MRALWKLLMLTLTLLASAGIASAVNSCCEKTIDGQWCAYVDATQCDTNLKSTFTSCEQTSYCATGCCYSSDTGQCFKNTAKAACAHVEGALWDASKDCSIEQCKLGCCLLGDQASFTTEVKCKKTASLFEELQYTFKSEITTEAQCVAEAKAQDEGCCVKADGCTFTSRGSCDAAAEITTNATKGAGFYKDQLCSNDLLDCDCAKQSTTKCFGEDLYWVDSCGNKENIYDSDKQKAYNKGYVLKESESCVLSGPEDQGCGNCDYPRGTICGKDTNKKMPVGAETCVNLACDKTYNDDAGASVNADGTRKKNGESWCVYDSMPGMGLDAVGSRHYRHLCINGEEQVVACKDFREEVCIQGVLDEAGKQQITSTYDAFFAKGDYVEAACRDNRDEGCLGCNNPEWADSKTGECGEACQEKRKKCCEDTSKDCYWADGYCAPQVPPGLQFWGEKKGEGKAEAPKGSADQKCSQMEPKVCQVVYHRGGWQRLGGEKAGWDIVANEDCTKKEWILTTNDICRSLGDCGAYFNVLSEATLDGYYNSLWDEEIFLDRGDVLKTKLKTSDLGEWHKLMGPPEASPEGGFFEKNFLHGTEGTIGPYLAGGFGVIGGLIPAAYAGITQWSWGALGTGLWGAPAAMGEATIAGVYGTAAKTAAQQAAESLVSSQASLTASQASLAQAKATIVNMAAGPAKVAAQNAIAQAEASLTAAQTQTAQLATQASTQVSILQANLAVAQANLAGAQASLTAATGSAGEAAARQAVETATKELAKVQAESAAGASTTAGFMTALNAAMWIYMAYKVVDIVFAETETPTYTIECLPWQAPPGGDDCEECNEPMKPCSEYKCKSLGQSCSLINKGLGNETCVAIDVNDATSPRITPLLSALAPEYQTEVEVVEDPSNPGYTIKKKIKPFTKVKVGIETDEPAQCKLAPEPGKKFEEMTQYFGSSIYKYEHTTSFTLPKELAKEQVVATNNGEYGIYIRCRDANENTNEKDYFIKFTIDASPDLTPPEVQYTSIVNNGRVAANVTQTQFSVYVNEPAECKWSRMDMAYELMENPMQCATTSFGQSSVFYGTYECKTALEGIGLQPTNYFIKCKDQPGAAEEDRNTNADSFKFTVQGSHPLQLANLGPEGVQYQNIVTLKAATAVGAENGKASCAFSQDNVPFENMILFAKTDDAFHEQLFEGMATGDYTFHVKCRDIAGNEVKDSTSFKVDIDIGVPRITELYVDGIVLHLEFDEKSTCEYSDKPGKAFGEGTMMTNANSTIHEASLNLNSYYIKCRDAFGNEGTYEIHL